MKKNKLILPYSRPKVLMNWYTVCKLEFEYINNIPTKRYHTIQQQQKTSHVKARIIGCISKLHETPLNTWKNGA